MKKALLLLLAVGVEGVAGEVGASNPQVVNTASTQLAAAIVDTGASKHWTAQPTEHKATERKTNAFEMRVEGFDSKVNMELEALISKKIQSEIAENEYLTHR